MQHDRSASAAPRRIKVNDRRSIYFRKDTQGRRRYEITYRDSEGRQRWKVVPGNLKDAEAALQEIRIRLRRGERVTPGKATFEEVADAWLQAQTELRPNTRAAYESALRNWLLPRFGRMKISQLTEDHVALLIADMRSRGKAGWTVRGSLTPLRRILAYAARRGMIGSNPMDRLERGERPSVGRREMRILSREEIGSLLEHASDRYRPLLATAVFTGLRLGELLGLTWANVDFDGGVVRVRRQLDRNGNRVEPKTSHAIRDVVLMPALARTLRQHRLRSEYAQESDLVFSSRKGDGLDHTVPRHALVRAMSDAKLARGDPPKLRFHDCRHTFASLLIASGGNVVFVSRQLGHGSPDITLRVYAHLFDAAEHAQRASAALEEGFAAVLDGNGMESSGGNRRQEAGSAGESNVAFLPESATDGN
jgi:integrase